MEHRKMRRSKRRITDKEKLQQVLERCQVVRIGTCDEEGMFIVPMNYGYEWQEDASGEVRLLLYLHSAKEGRKVDAFEKNPSVAIELDCEHALITGDYTCSYSYGYASIMGNGRIRLVTDAREKEKGLQLLMAHTAPGAEIAIQQEMLAAVNVYCIQVEYFTGKTRTAK